MELCGKRRLKSGRNKNDVFAFYSGICLIFSQCQDSPVFVDYFDTKHEITDGLQHEVNIIVLGNMNVTQTYRIGVGGLIIIIIIIIIIYKYWIYTSLPGPCSELESFICKYFIFYIFCFTFLQKIISMGKNSLNLLQVRSRT